MSPAPRKRLAMARASAVVLTATVGMRLKCLPTRANILIPLRPLGKCLSRRYSDAVVPRIRAVTPPVLALCKSPRSAAKSLVCPRAANTNVRVVIVLVVPTILTGVLMVPKLRALMWLCICIIKPLN